jgi:hypothetical protein
MHRESFSGLKARTALHGSMAGKPDGAMMITDHGTPAIQVLHLKNSNIDLHTNSADRWWIPGRFGMRNTPFSQRRLVAELDDVVNINHNVAGQASRLETITAIPGIIPGLQDLPTCEIKGSSLNSQIFSRKANTHNFILEKDLRKSLSCTLAFAASQIDLAKGQNMKMCSTPSEHYRRHNYPQSIYCISAAIPRLEDSRDPFSR